MIKNRFGWAHVNMLGEDQGKEAGPGLWEAIDDAPRFMDCRGVVVCDLR